MLRTSKSILNKEITGNGRKVFVGLSGGVDSAVSAALLKDQGYDVTGVFIKVWHPDFLPCKWKEERRDAMRVAIRLGIPFLFLDLEEEYKKGVADYMIDEYGKGRTPNPDVFCNREVKFGAFWREAKKRGADFIATGHYARVTANNYLEEGKDKEKDQSYFLWTVTPNDLEHVIFPIGHLVKSEVRKLAKKYKIPVAEKKDSQGVCFIGEITLEDFLSRFIKTEGGDVLNTSGEVIGRHNGALFYTMGERHGFEITKKSPNDGAYYVVAKDMEKNTITVSNKESEIISLSPKKVVVTNHNFYPVFEGQKLAARIRYRQKMVPVSIMRSGSDLIAEFEEPQRGLSLGQSIVFYADDVCAGGGVMDRIIN